jgi:glycosyltransferase involved in cell wall biosynthesis
MIGKALITHDWIEKFGGAEIVLEALADTFPGSEIYTLWSDVEMELKVSQSWLSKSWIRKHKQLALPFMDAAFRNLHFPEADFLITTSHLFAHHSSIAGRPDIKKFSYIHTPARYIWDPASDPRGNSLQARLASPLLKPLDRRRAQESTSFAANSSYVRSRIQLSWGRDAEVIYPPVDVEYFGNYSSQGFDEQEFLVLDKLPDVFNLAASRFISYKNLDLAIHVSLDAGQPIVVAGTGPLLRELKELQSKHPKMVYILEAPSRRLLKALYHRAKCLIYLAIEDFGIIPVEAMASGLPVLAVDKGGLLETVTPGVSGEFVSLQDISQIAKSLKQLKREDYAECSSTVSKFGKQRFQSEIECWVSEGIR